MENLIFKKVLKKSPINSEAEPEFEYKLLNDWRRDVEKIQKNTKTSENNEMLNELNKEDTTMTMNEIENISKSSINNHISISELLDKDDNYEKMENTLSKEYISLILNEIIMNVICLSYN